ncbi:MAG: M23 family metallopeptidase [Actinobacteria bacterium]|nr:M23 family metallopeptidase [Actinomycetota bacterium]
MSSWQVYVVALIAAAVVGAAAVLAVGRLPDEPVVVATDATATEPAAAQPPPGATGAPQPTTSTTAPGEATPAETSSPTPAAPPATPTPPAPAPPAPAQRYAFPVVGEADYGRDHHDYPATDIFAACGTPVVAPASGVIDELLTDDTWDPAVDDPATRGGLAWAVVGDDGVRYYGSHMEALAHDLAVGARVEAGELLGTVGRSGNAATTPCHLHFGLSPPRGPGDWEVRRGVVWPWPYLDAWRAGEHRSPAAEVAAWAAANP